MRPRLTIGIRQLTVAATLLATASAGAAQSTTPKPRPGCTAPEHRQFDFWIGTWDVTTQGKPAGTNRIASDLQGCVIVENWEAAGGGRGTSLNFYDRATKRWYQTWMDQGGNALRLSGGLQNGQMVMQNEPDPAAPSLIQRITWTPTAGGLRQLWETSKDAGTTWTVAFDGTYTKKKTP
jgi:hypothetical protein